MKRFFNIAVLILVLVTSSCWSKSKKIKNNKPIILTSKNFESVIKNGIVVIDFWAEWCQPCKKVSPIIEELIQEMPNITFAKLNVDKNKKIANNLRIRSIPTLYIFNDGEIADGIVGLNTKDKIKEKIQGVIESSKLMASVKSGEKKFTDIYDFTLPDENGNKVKLSKIKGMIILDFWATWCGPCKAEIPYLQKFYNQYKDKGLTIIGVTSESKDKLTKFKKDMKDKGTNISYVLLFDNTHEISSKLGIRSIPTTYFISPDGKLIKKETGFAPQLVDNFKKIIEDNLPTK